MLLRINRVLHNISYSFPFNISMKEFLWQNCIAVWERRINEILFCFFKVFYKVARVNGLNLYPSPILILFEEQGVLIEDNLAVYLLGFGVNTAKFIGDHELSIQLKICRSRFANPTHIFQIFKEKIQIK